MKFLELNGFILGEQFVLSRCWYREELRDGDFHIIGELGEDMPGDCTLAYDSESERDLDWQRLIDFLG